MIGLHKLVIFGVGSAGILWLSWGSLRDSRAHGFYRFFSFEGILALILLNLDYWFRDPFSLWQLLSWLLLLGSALLAAHGFYLLGAVGKPDGDFEATTVLVTKGVYRYLRHPLYSSLFLFSWGVFLKHPSLPGGVLALAISAFLWATAKVEERELVEKFGDDYLEYMRTTKRFIPYLF